MSEHRATVEWQLQGEFRYETYSRAHRIDFGDGIAIGGTAAAANVPKTAPAVPGADPEQQFVAALSSCHMLWFLHLACRRNLIVARYRDEAVGVLGKDSAGKDAMVRVTLRPLVTFAGTPPSPQEHARIHEKAHERCFIANSVTSEVILEPRVG